MTAAICEAERGMSGQKKRRLTVEQTQRADAVIFAFAKLWPSCFQVFQRRRHPLMIGIAEALIAQMEPVIKAGRISESDIRLALVRYTGATSYLQCCSIVGDDRIDLGGQTVGAVTKLQAKSARGRIAKRKARRVSKYGRGTKSEGVIENRPGESA